MITVRFKGALARMYAPEYKLAASSPADAFAALKSMLPDFVKILRENNFQIRVGKDYISESDLRFSFGTHTEMTVMIAAGGAGGKSAGLGMIVAGIAILVVAWWNPAGWGAAAQMMAYGLGAGIAASGLGMVLMPSVGKTPADEDGNKASYGFGGAVTTVSQGNIVPVAYGECWQGGFVLTWNITSERI